MAFTEEGSWGSVSHATPRGKTLLHELHRSIVADKREKREKKGSDFILEWRS